MKTNSYAIKYDRTCETVIHFRMELSAFSMSEFSFAASCTWLYNGETAASFWDAAVSTQHY